MSPLRRLLRGDASLPPAPSRLLRMAALAAMSAGPGVLSPIVLSSFVCCASRAPRRRGTTPRSSSETSAKRPVPAPCAPPRSADMTSREALQVIV